MTDTTDPTSGCPVTGGTAVWNRFLDHESRPDPYPLYADLREGAPVQRLDDGAFLITGYDEILQVVHDPRISSNPLAGRADTEDAGPSLTSAFVMQDPPDHDRLRRQTMRHFGPPNHAGYIDSLREDIARAAAGLIDAFPESGTIDLVEAYAYPLPVMMICDVLGVPHEDEPRFHAWSAAIIAPPEATTPDEAATLQREAATATQELGAYLGGLAELRRGTPQGDLLSGLVNDHGPDGAMTPSEMISTTIMLLIGGHETTVNMIANGALTLLRNPEALEQLIARPETMPGVFEELLRLEPPAQVTPKYVALEDVQVGTVTITKGSPVWIAWAAGNRDPRHFAEPDRFDPERDSRDHLGFGAGIHACFGAPLARLETQIALAELFSRLENPRLVTDPPPYRRNPLLRGPSRLEISFDSVARA
ncbi:MULTISPECIES: cytochrome P450 [unclassified Frondihabitans]|uniref:cytochrome P450 n=1 Tax=unclassified Frondihabitans TaxID=2626248 RepID=UPI000F4DB0F5|nr:MULTISPECIES: cytochrome P450 [unclassified Frondihabitans]RPE77849.1 cytochrome P450 [Frondihabitans sp. PhB153]RPF08128.1 cytochrome P450 [Frondihabitans sp. PhB161]